MTEVLSSADRAVGLALELLGVRMDERLRGVRESVEAVLEAGVPGDILTSGLSLGDTAVFSRALLAAYHANERWIWLSSPRGGSADYDDVRAALRACEGRDEGVELDDGVDLDERVRFVREPWGEALGFVPFERLAVLHLAAGSGDAVDVLLDELYPRVSPGGFILVDEYDANGFARDAVKRFRRIRGMTSSLRPFGAGGVLWRKERE